MHPKIMLEKNTNAYAVTFLKSRMKIKEDIITKYKMQKKKNHNMIQVK